MNTINIIPIALLGIALPTTAGLCAATDSPAIPTERRDYYVLTPPVSAEPRINGARVFGVRPGSPFLFSIPATGAAPLSYSVEGLPHGLEVNANDGRITGVISDTTPRIYHVMLQVSNRLSVARREFRIVVGDEIALTPPMGWNSWNCWARAIDAEKLLKTARAMAERLKGHGWTFVNVDDSWQGNRDGPDRAIQGNEKFPDMQKLIEEVHALGLKFGLYSTPWVTSYAGFCGGSADTADGVWKRPKNREETLAGRRHGTVYFDESDAKQWAEWGVDYLKYDWFPNDLPSAQRMADALRRQRRDIVYSISNASPFELASELAGVANAWRTGTDMGDFWASDPVLQAKGCSSVLDVWRKEERWNKYSRPGHWPDPDMLVVGRVGWGPVLHPSRLTPDEQYTHISLWCLWSAPLLIGCPIDDIDDFTFNLLSNDEVLAVNQDPLGQRATIVSDDGNLRVLAKKLEDGTLAVGLFNLSESAQRVKVQFSRLGIAGSQKARDLWRQKDLGDFRDEFAADVPPHGVVLVKLSLAGANITTEQ
jgi:alpha-galactosidase